MGTGERERRRWGVLGGWSGWGERVWRLWRDGDRRGSFGFAQDRLFDCGLRPPLRMTLVGGGRTTATATATATTNAGISPLRASVEMTTLYRRESGREGISIPAGNRSKVLFLLARSIGV